MAPPWLQKITSFFMKRHRAKNRVTRFTFDDDDDVDPNTPSCVPIPEKHRHVDWSYGTERMSTQTAYFDTPSSPKRHTRASSLPSLAAVTPSTVDDVSNGSLAEPLDIEYLINQIELVEEDSVRRERTAGDRPLLQWLDEAGDYLREFLRLEGRGDFAHSLCPCGAKDALAAYRCDDCCDLRLHCEACVVQYHARHPLHRVQRWTGEYFAHVSLKSLGVRVQLGHALGDPCPRAKPAFGDDFVLLDVMGIHEIGLDYCGCYLSQPYHIQLLRSSWFPATTVNPKTAATFRILESFQILSNQSKVSAWEYYSSLARMTDNTGTNPPKDRYRAFMVMIREWRHLKMMKRAGRGNEAGGIGDTSAGACAVECPACPIPDKNLPPDWKDAPPQKSWLYRLFVGIDANFRLKRKKVSSDAMDPSLNKGCAYVVEETAYKAHLACFDSQLVEPTDHCNNHDAVKLATLKNAAGLAATGVATVDCARHDMKRPCSTGDLQKGERYINIDYLLSSTLRQNAPTNIAASYDIACQYSKNLDKRFPTYGFDISAHELSWAIPKFHINAHREQCRADYNLHYLLYSARNDGEAVERLWAKSNPAAASTKEMGPGSRRDFLDDIFSHHNWVKVTQMAYTLLRKIKKAVPERDAHTLAFEQYHSSLPAEATARWRSAVEAWEADNKSPNPFLVQRKALSEAAAKRQITEEDAQQLQDGTAIVLHEKYTASGVVIHGLELEDQQRRLKADYALLGTYATDVQRARMQERANLLRRRIDAWAEIQQLYTPGIASQRERLMSQSETACLPQNIPLLLPSTANGLIYCPATMLDQEWRLRHGQAHDALNDLRGDLEVRSHILKMKDRFMRGQRANTRARTIVQQTQAKIDMDSERYRVAYQAMYMLSGPLAKLSWQGGLRPLLAADIRHVTECEDGVTEGRKAMSWIWSAGDPMDSAAGPGQLQDSLQESLRVEWCKARARAHRWSEEVELLQEEMRRVVAYHDWAAQQWRDRVDKLENDNPAYREGANAYALRQTSIRESIRNFCQTSWRYVPDWVALGDDDDTSTVTGPGGPGLSTA
ncbi:hypothetical protein TRAPUB_763 [Trametes pubescens]|uniref:CxC2-like cysteine cluster KDZ transposase-associated domain-containing protein n=1 Tax=Trametes pubescens TaxID=154538 RepID=A0A1M2VLA4_TRAPU|nr:hypothetical protein TRAPUB_763 [Trametes pubescens]